MSEVRMERSTSEDRIGSGETGLSRKDLDDENETGRLNHLHVDLAGLRHS